ncbi:MAG TPA: hypothetical protein VGF36_01490 [Rhodopila sp.]
MLGPAVDARCFNREAREDRNPALRAGAKALFDSAYRIANDCRFPRTRPERSRAGDPLGKLKTKG